MTTTEVEVEQEVKPKRTMSAEHKLALAAGRDQTRAVNNYLAALGSTKKRRGRQVTVESLQTRLDKAVTELAGDPSPVEKLLLTEQVKKLKHDIEAKRATTAVDLPKLEAEFIRVAKSFADHRGITRATFIENGVEKRVLEAAGI